MKTGRYGPNTAQVERFLERVAALSPAERERIVSEDGLARSAYGGCDVDEVQVGAMSMYGHDHEQKWLNAADNRLRTLTEGFQSDFRILAARALMGLLLCEVMHSEEFAAWYGAFAHEIPIQSLGDGLAPSVAPAPPLPCQRFVTRARRLENPEGVVSTFDMLCCAMGGMARHQAAIDAVEASISSAPDSPWREYELKALGEALDDIGTVGDQALDQGKQLRSMIGRAMIRDGVLKDPEDWARRSDAAHARQSDFMDTFRRCCIDGVFAVALFTKIPDEHAYYLYLPFEATIPLDSILP